jgi:hypothetical protein
MPLYEFQDTKTGEKYEMFMKIVDKENYLLAHPTIRQVMHAPNIVRGVSVKNKLGGFSEVLQKVGEKHPGSNLDKQVNRRSAKDIKTAAVIKKHKEKNV